MTASPTAITLSPPTKSAEGGNALAALFAAATASSMKRQISATTNKNKHHAPTFASIAMTTPTTNNSTTKPTKKQQSGTPSSATKLIATDNVSSNNNNSAVNLIASLLNGSAKSLSSTPPSFSTPRSVSSSSLPLTKTTATFTTTFAKNRQEPPTKATNGTPAKSASLLKQYVSTEPMPNNVELRNLESWHDESEGKLDDSCYQELVDSGNTNGWSADEMFKYNEKRHKILSCYSEKTLSDKYTTPVPRMKSKLTMRMATKLAKEIEDKVIAEGRVTPESSDDDELFEQERTKRIQLKQLKFLNTYSNMKMSINFAQNRLPSNGNHASNNRNSSNINNNNHFGPPNTNYIHVASSRKSNRSSSQHSNSSATPATASLSSSPTLNDSNMIMKPVTSSSRNILRTCLI